MSRGSWNRLLLCIMLVLAAPCVQAGWPALEEPPQSLVEPIGGDINLTGLPMRIWIFSSKLPPERILSYYRDRWSDAFVENQFGDWQQISRKEDDYFITVQVQSDEERGTVGRISMLHMHDRPVETPGLGVPRMQGSQIINDVRSTDSGRRNRSVVLSNTYSVESNSDYYRQHYLGLGWGIVNAQDVDGNHMAVYRKGSDEVTVVVNAADGGSFVLINEVKATGFFSW